MKERTQFNYAQRWRIEQDSNQRTLKDHKSGIAAFMIVGLLLVALLAFPWIWQIVLQNKLNTIEESIGNYQEAEVALQEIERLEAEVAKLDILLKTAEESPKNLRTILPQVRKLLPDGATITSFSLQAENSIQLGLELPGSVDVARLWVSFRDSGLFADFDLKTVSLTEESQNLNLTLKMK